MPFIALVIGIIIIEFLLPYWFPLLLRFVIIKYLRQKGELCYEYQFFHVENRYMDLGENG